MKIPVYILDNELQAIDRLQFLFENFFADEVIVIGRTTEPEHAFVEIEDLKPQIIFADVEMPKMTGLDFSNKLFASGYQGKLFFLTAYDQYSIRTIRANAFDYLVKPVDIDKLKNCIERFKKMHQEIFNLDIVRHYGLSIREYDIVKWLAEGVTSEEVGEKLFLSRHTVEIHQRNILAKTGARNTVEMINILRNK